MAKLHGAIVDAGRTPTQFGFLLSLKPDPRLGGGVVRLWSNRCERVFGGCFSFAGGEEILLPGLCGQCGGRGIWAGADFRDAGRGRQSKLIEPNRGRRRVVGKSVVGDFYQSSNGWARHEKLG